jgi:hypothetical protein
LQAILFAYLSALRALALNFNTPLPEIEAVNSNATITQRLI